MVRAESARRRAGSLQPVARTGCYHEAVSFDGYKVVLYRNHPDGWVAEIPSIAGCHALMATPEEALAELATVFDLIAAEHLESGTPLPQDTTEIVHA